MNTSWTSKKSVQTHPAPRLANKILLVNLGREHDDTPPIAEALKDHGFRVERINLLLMDFSKMDLSNVAAVDLKDCRGWQANFDFFKKQMQILQDKIRETGREIPIVNPPKMFDWVASKEYLREFSRKGVPIVPTTFLHRGDDWPDISSMLDATPDKKIVLKPARGSRAADIIFITKLGADEFELTCPKPLSEAPTPHVMIMGHEALKSFLKGYEEKLFYNQQQPAILIQQFCRGKEISAVLIGSEAHYVERTTGKENSIAHEDFGGTNVPQPHAEPAVVAFANQVRSALPENLVNSPYVRVDMLCDADKPPLLLEVEAGSARLFLVETQRTNEYADMLAKCVVVARRKSKAANHEPMQMTSSL